MPEIVLVAVGAAVLVYLVLAVLVGPPMTDEERRLRQDRKMLVALEGHRRIRDAQLRRQGRTETTAIEDAQRTAEEQHRREEAARTAAEEAERREAEREQAKAAKEEQKRAAKERAAAAKAARAAERVEADERRRAEKEQSQRDTEHEAAPVASTPNEEVEETRESLPLYTWFGADEADRTDARAD